MQTGSAYKVCRGWFGRQAVKYECPHCSDRLRSPLSEAGTVDRCPKCNNAFRVPGLEALQQIQAAEVAAAEYAAKVKADAIEAKRRRNEEQAQRQEQLRQQAERERQERVRLAEESREQQAATPPNQSAQNPPTGGKRRWRRRAAAAAGLVILFFIYSYVRNSGLRSHLERCESYGLVNVRVGYAGVFGTDTVVFDLRDGGSSGARRIDPVHLLMQFGDNLNLYDIRHIVLARNGTHRFHVSGTDLHPLVASYAGGGRPWAFFNLPAKVRRMNGAAAFEEWSGGWLGVLKEQTEDLEKFLKEWVDNDSLGSYSSPLSLGTEQPDDVRSRVRETLAEMEDNVPETLQSMEDDLPDVMADMEAQMMEDAAKYGLSPSDVRSQLQDIEAGAREQIRGMEDDVREQIRGMEDEVVESLSGDNR